MQMNIINSLEWRYATKKFDPSKKLTIQQIETLKKAFNLTATSFGLQPLKLIVIENKELQEEFVEHCYFQRQVADASHLLVYVLKMTPQLKQSMLILIWKKKLEASKKNRFQLLEINLLICTKTKLWKRNNYRQHTKLILHWAI